MAMITNNPYEFDTDKNGQILFTQKNLDFVTAIISNDSDYRGPLFENDPNYSKGYIENKCTTPNFLTIEEHVKKIVELIDVENSTHLAASPKLNPANQGRRLTVEKILSIDNLLISLGEGDPNIVAEIARAVPGKNNFSFATKFCTYVCRYYFKDSRADNYSIYDRVLSNAIPYFAWVYLGEIHFARKNGTIEKEYKFTQDYGSYRNLIDRIRESIEKKNGTPISREKFDHLLWYYYKGSDDRIKQANTFIGKDSARM